MDLGFSHKNWESFMKKTDKSDDKKFASIFLFYSVLLLGTIYIISSDLIRIIEDFMQGSQHKPFSLLQANFIESEMFKNYANQKFSPLRIGVNKQSNQILDHMIDMMIYQKFLKGHPYVETKLSLPIYMQKHGKKWVKEKNELKKIINLDGEELGPEAFYFHHGLRFANAKIRDYIKNKNILDCGSYIGDSLIILQNYTNQTIYCYDFCKPNIEKFKKIVKLNKVNNNYKMIESALGEEVKTISIESRKNVDAGARLKTGNDELVKITTIDEEVKKHNMRVGFIKMDVEGHALEVIKGAINTIKKQRPVLSISIYHSPSELFDVKPFLEQHVENYIFEFDIEQFSIGDFPDTVLFAYPKELA